MSCLFAQVIILDFNALDFYLIYIDNSFYFRYKEKMEILILLSEILMKKWEKVVKDIIN